MDRKLFLTLREVFRYLKADPNSRNVCEGEALIMGGWTIVGCTEESTNVIKISGRCIQTSNVSGQPHKIEGCLNVSVDNTVSIANFTCSCKAGSENCKHIASVLLSCRELDTLQQFSTTDIDCYWSERNKKPTGKNEVQPVPLHEFCHFKKCAPFPELFMNAQDKELFGSKAHEVLFLNSEQSLVGETKKRARAFQAYEERDNRPPKTARLQDQLISTSPISHQKDSGFGTTMEGWSAELDSSFETPFTPPYVTSTPQRERRDPIVHSAINCSPIAATVHEFSFSSEFTDLINNCEVSESISTIFEHIQCNETLNSLPEVTESALSHCCYTSYSSLAVSKEMAMQICLAEQGSPLWKSSRKFRITGSTSYNIFTAGSRGPCNWDHRVRSVISPPEISYLPAIQHGRSKEKEALEVYCSSKGLVHQSFGLVIPPSQPWLGFSPDGVVFYDGKPSKLLEVKCPLAGKNANVKDLKLPFLTVVNDMYLIKKCHSYYGQIQLGLAILNLPVCDLVVHASWDRSQLVVPVHRNEEFIAKYLSTLHTKYFKFILHYKCTYIP